MRTSGAPYKLAEAKAKLGRLCEQTRRGKPARIIRQGEIFELVHIKRVDVAPATLAELRACADDPDEIRLLNRFGKESL
jgi:hypothetical protein